MWSHPTAPILPLLRCSATDCTTWLFAEPLLTSLPCREMLGCRSGPAKQGLRHIWMVEVFGGGEVLRNNSCGDSRVQEWVGELS